MVNLKLVETLSNSTLIDKIPLMFAKKIATNFFMSLYVK